MLIKANARLKMMGNLQECLIWCWLPQKKEDEFFKEEECNNTSERKYAGQSIRVKMEDTRIGVTEES